MRPRVNAVGLQSVLQWCRSQPRRASVLGFVPGLLGIFTTLVASTQEWPVQFRADYFDGWSGTNRAAPSKPCASDAPSHLTKALATEFKGRQPVWVGGAILWKSYNDRSTWPRTMAFYSGRSAGITTRAPTALNPTPSTRGFASFSKLLTVIVFVPVCSWRTMIPTVFRDPRTGIGWHATGCPCSRNPNICG